MIAQSARSQGVALDDLGVRVVFVTSERLYDYQQKSIETVFGCPVANGYGGRDAGFIAAGAGIRRPMIAAAGCPSVCAEGGRYSTRT